MDLQYVLLNPNGRIAPREFWIGVLLLIAGNVLSGLVPVLGGLLWLFLIYVGVCVYGKRLHDAGKSAWIHVIPWGLTLLISIIGGMMIGGAIISAVLSGDDFNPWAMVTAGSGFALMMGLSNLVWLVYTLWAGLAQGQAGANAYGPAPVRTIEATASTDD
ncbi:DUF805 domain-containing protein [Maricaulis sp.]|uniref:DUF805 domain-containing protein n=1 Tax=Maricaulis sp. TaxID=1486257 RepID=UPI0026215C11|nr:DUF805 domain-containing protein [Maricaulis sp.]